MGRRGDGFAEPERSGGRLREADVVVLGDFGPGVPGGVDGRWGVGCVGEVYRREEGRLGVILGMGVGGGEGGEEGKEEGNGKVEMHGLDWLVR